MQATDGIASTGQAANEAAGLPESNLDEVPREGLHSIWRLALLAAALIGALLIIHLTPLNAWLHDARRLREALAGQGAWVEAIAVVAVAALLACGVPRLPIHALGGAVFGLWHGLLITLGGAMLGHYAAFCFIRWLGRDLLRDWPKLRKWGDLIHDQGIVGVVLARQLPAHAMLINLCLGLSTVKHRHFLIGTAIGLIPEAIPATLVGAGLMKASLKDSTAFIGFAVVSVAIIWIVIAYVIRDFAKKKRGDTAAEKGIA